MPRFKRRHPGSLLSPSEASGSSNARRSVIHHDLGGFRGDFFASSGHSIKALVLRWPDFVISLKNGIDAGKVTATMTLIGGNATNDSTSLTFCHHTDVRHRAVFVVSLDLRCFVFTCDVSLTPTCAHLAAGRRSRRSPGGATLLH